MMRLCLNHHKEGDVIGDHTFFSHPDVFACCGSLTFKADLEKCVMAFENYSTRRAMQTRYIAHALDMETHMIVVEHTGKYMTHCWRSFRRGRSFDLEIW